MKDFQTLSTKWAASEMTAAAMPNQTVTYPWSWRLFNTAAAT